jgi:DNA polymerase-3 subunit epsilon
MKLNLERPLIFLDTETTGKSVDTDRIVEICAKKVWPNGDSETRTRRLNPTIPISPGATAIHGISDEDVAQCPTFREVAVAFFDFIGGCDIVGYNAITFDVPLIANEFARCGINWRLNEVNLIDPCVIFKQNEPRDLSNAYKYFCNKTLEGAHGAEADTNACEEIFYAQTERYPELPNDIKSLALYSNYGKPHCDIVGRKFAIDDDGDYIFKFGNKHRNEKAKNNLDYVQWMTKQNNPPFANDTLEICFKILNESGSQFNMAKNELGFDQPNKK